MEGALEEELEEVLEEVLDGVLAEALEVVLEEVEGQCQRLIRKPHVALRGPAHHGLAQERSSLRALLPALRDLRCCQ